MVTLFLLAAVLAGCSSTEPGTPTAGGQTPTGTSTGTTGKSAPVNRPKVVDLKTVDPCALVTPETKTALAIATVEPRNPKAEYGEGSKTCGASYVDHKYTWSLYTIVNGGAARLKETTPGITPVQVAGYPAFQAKGPSAATKSPECEFYLDVHDERLLRVSVVGGWGEQTTEDGACERARPLAEAAGKVLAAG
ncbi:hypothetical protein ADL03_44510 [Nocardia sp. NRRL S-836]|nr:hypothetical protein ADL03_44510 [Nocardia sp. NRRL S-836]